METRRAGGRHRRAAAPGERRPALGADEQGPAARSRRSTSSASSARSRTSPSAGAPRNELNRTLDELDKRVQQRTTDLERAIESLRREVDDRVRVQAEERQQRAYAEALRDTASAMSKTLDVRRGDGAGAHRRRAAGVRTTSPPSSSSAADDRARAGPLPRRLRLPDARSRRHGQRRDRVAAAPVIDGCASTSDSIIVDDPIVRARPGQLDARGARSGRRPRHRLRRRSRA